MDPMSDAPMPAATQAPVNKGRRKYATKREMCSAVDPKTGAPKYARTERCAGFNPSGPMGRRGARFVPPDKQALEPCLMDSEYMALMTERQIRLFARRFHYVLPAKGARGGRPLKSELLAAVRSQLPKQCDPARMAAVVHDPGRATYRDLSLYVRGHGMKMPPPCRGATSKCPVSSGKKGCNKQQCKSEYVDLVRIASEKPLQPKATRPEDHTLSSVAQGKGSGSESVSSVVPPDVPSASVGQYIATVSQAGAVPGKALDNGSAAVGLPESPLSVSVSVLVDKGKAPVETITITGGKTAEGEAISFDEQARKVNTLFKMSSDDPERLVISIKDGQQHEYEESIFNSVWRSNPTFLVDKKCLPYGDYNGGGTKFSRTGKLIAVSSSRSAFLQSCVETREGVTECDKHILYVEQLPNAEALRKFKVRMNEYANMNKYDPEHTLKLEHYWVCDSTSVPFLARDSWVQLRRSELRGTVAGFAVVQVPVGYSLMPLRDFLLNKTDPSRGGEYWSDYVRTVGNWLAVWRGVETRWIESMVPNLIDAMHIGWGAVPNTLSPESFGVLVGYKERAYEDDSVWPYRPVLLPGADELRPVPDPRVYSECVSQIIVDKTQILNLVRLGMTAGGMPTSYQEVPNATRLVLTAYGIYSFWLVGSAVLGAASAWLQGAGYGINSWGLITTFKGEPVLCTVARSSQVEAIKNAVRAFFTEGVRGMWKDTYPTLGQSAASVLSWVYKNPINAVVLGLPWAYTCDKLVRMTDPRSPSHRPDLFTLGLSAALLAWCCGGMTAVLDFTKTIKAEYAIPIIGWFAPTLAASWLPEKTAVGKMIEYISSLDPGLGTLWGYISEAFAPVAAGWRAVADMIKDKSVKLLLVDKVTGALSGPAAGGLVAALTNQIRSALLSVVEIVPKHPVIAGALVSSTLLSALLLVVDRDDPSVEAARKTTYFRDWSEETIKASYGSEAHGWFESLLKGPLNLLADGSAAVSAGRASRSTEDSIHDAVAGIQAEVMNRVYVSRTKQDMESVMKDMHAFAKNLQAQR